jgi:uncharacterized membrane protein
MSEKPTRERNIIYAGVGIPIGAAVGFIFGLLLFDNMALGAGAGAAVGLIIGAIIDAQRNR